jgi:hypothetical protein
MIFGVIGWPVKNLGRAVVLADSQKGETWLVETRQRGQVTTAANDRM